MIAKHMNFPTRFSRNSESIAGATNVSSTNTMAIGTTDSRNSRERSSVIA